MFDRRLTHIQKVHKANVGDELCVGLLNGQIGKGRLILLEKDKLEMEITLSEAPPEKLPVTLILALPRPKVFKRVLLSATAMGVKRIFLIHSYRVEKSYWLTPKLSDESLHDIFIHGLEQAKDTVSPTIFLKKRFKPFAEDDLPEIISGTLPIVLHPGSSKPCPHLPKTPITLAIGPEGGFIPYEINKFKELGFQDFHFGKRILPVETAVPAILSRLCFVG